MPIYYEEPTPGPASDTSSDGRVEAILHTAWSSVLVIVDVSDLPGPPESVVINRGGVPVATMVAPSGQIVWYDHFPTLGADAAYTVTAGGVTSEAATVGVPALGLGRCWIKSAVDPNLSLDIVLESVSDSSRAQDLGLFRVPGRRDPVAVAGVRASREETWRVVALDAAQRDAVWALLDAGGPYRLDGYASLGREGMWARVSDVSEQMLGDTEHGAWLFTLPVVEVAAPPASQVVRVPGWGWDDVVATYGSWDAVSETSWLDLIRAGVS